MKSNGSILSKKRLEIFFPSPENYSFKLGRVNYFRAHPPIGQHVHEGMMEIVLIIKGRQIYTASGNEYTINSGEVFITFPDEPHSTADYPEDKSMLYYLIIDLEKLKNGFIGSDNEEGNLIVKTLMNIEKRVFKGSEDLKPILDGIITAYLDDAPFKKATIRNLLSCFIINIIKCERTIEIPSSCDMQVVLSYIERNIFEDINVPILAEVAGLSIARFKANFRKQTGIPPREFVLRSKIKIAKELLKNSEITITELAHKLSFSSSQYFSTVFKRFTLMTPGEFRNYWVN